MLHEILQIEALKVDFPCIWLKSVVTYLLAENISTPAFLATIASEVPASKEVSESEDLDAGENVHLRLTEENIMGDELKESDEINEYDTRSEVSSSSSDSSSMSSMNSSSSESEHEPGKLNCRYCVYCGTN
jgi:hypothetical protein